MRNLSSKVAIIPGATGGQGEAAAKPRQPSGYCWTAHRS